MIAVSYARGTSRVPLLGVTIGEQLRRTAENFPDCEALVVRSQAYQATYRRLWDAAEEFPMTVTGKIQKFRMRELSIGELGLGDAAAIRTA
jgi:acyl-coenzyme A synthetase/AMP-(fatty) acid ligase